MGNMRTQISHVLNDPAEFWITHQVTGNPTTVFVSADGSIERHAGNLYAQELLSKVEALSGT